MIIGKRALRVFRNALHSNAEIPEIFPRDVENDVAIVEMSGVSAAAAQRNRPSAFA
jgi:hypothetical protein